MLRVFLGSLGVAALMAATSAFAADSGISSTNKSNERAQGKNNHYGATVSRVDSQNDKLTVEITGRDGKQSEKTLDLEKDAAVRDRHGKTAKLSDLKPGDVVRITEDNGKVSKIDEQNVATITKVDAKTGTVTVQMPDENGKHVSRVFHLTGNAEYIDSNGNVAVLDVFQVGDRILFVEEDGKIAELSQTANERNQSPNLTQRPGTENANRK